ncbi:MAG: sigma-54 dependent transcriptional regulator [bacterium]|nr:sigma-54 dependent transcriptional regulator [bacterium]
MPKRHILIVDDEPNLQETIKINLELNGFNVSLASDGAEALKQCEIYTFDMVLLDMRMPVMNGLETLKHLRENSPDQMVIMFTAHGSIENAVEAMKLGACDYITKSSDPEEVNLRIQMALDNSEEIRMLKSQLRDKYRFEGIVGTSAPMQEVYGLVERIANTESTVLIIGATGTGKELIARAIHYNGPRAEKRLYSLHCAAIPEELLESELFGHEKGAFTGAISQKEGIFEAANAGTLFLDEVGEMSLNAQVRLLRVLQEKEFTPVGSTTPQKTDVRLIAATHRNLAEEVQESRFREDLFYRLNVIEIHLPPLRERRDDIPLLVKHFLSKHATDREIDVSDEAIDRLVRHDWPGNVRELENVIERAVALSLEETLQVSDLPPALQEGASASLSATESYAHLPLREARDSFEQIYIKEVLTKTGGNITHASKMAGIAWQNFHQKLKKYEINAKSFANKGEK